MPHGDAAEEAVPHLADLEEVGSAVEIQYD